MNINLIPDEVLKLNKDNDLLGTKPYSNTIFEIVKKTEGKKNIGLFGSWGSGKSTIIKTLEGKIETHNYENINDKIGFFEFDAWKYSEDDFRRSFIVSINKSFEIPENGVLTRSLYNDTNVESPELTQRKISQFSLANWIVLAIVVFVILFNFSSVMDEEDATKNILSIIALIVSVALSAVNNTFVRYKVNVKHNRVIEPEIFEVMFKDVIKVLTEKKSISTYIPKWVSHFQEKPKFNKIVIVIDNLDRCDNSNLLLTLNTIKNFLESDKVIFILPVDEKGVYSFLSNSTDNAGEYLRKVFHIIIRLKVYSRKELLEFTEELNQTYQLDLSSQSVRLICQEFSSNPRKIIQFLNNYQSEIKLLEEQSDLGYVEGDFVKEYISFFIKLLIIKSEWRSLYESILYDKSLLNKINEVITYVEPDDNDEYPIKKSKVKLSDIQRNFFFSTQNIHCSRIDPFILNIDLDKDVPDEIEDFIKYSNYEGITDYLNTSESFEIEHFLKKMGEVYEDFTYKHRDYIFIALPIMVLNNKFFLDKEQVSFREELIENYKNYPFFKSLFNDSLITEIFMKLNFEDLTKMVKWFLVYVNDDLYKPYLSYVREFVFNSEYHGDKPEEKMKIFFSEFTGLDEFFDVKKEFNNFLVNRISLEGLSAIDSEKRLKIITKPTIVKLSNLLKGEDGKVEDSVKSEVLNLIISYLDSAEGDRDKLLMANSLKYLLDNLHVFSVGGLDEDDFEVFEDDFDKISTVLKTKVDYEFEDGYIAKLENINNFLFEFYDGDYSDNEHGSVYQSFFSMIMKIIINVKGFRTVEIAEEYFNRYLEKDVSEELSLFLNNIIYEDVSNFNAFDYPYVDSLMKKYQETHVNYNSYGKTLLLMIKKSVNSEGGLDDASIKSIIRWTVSHFVLRKLTNDNINNMIFLKKHSKDLLLGVINHRIRYPNYYIRRVKKLKDKWFYGNAILNYLNDSLKGEESNFSTFKSNIILVRDTFNVDEQINFVEELFKANQDFVLYNWFKSFHKILPKQVFDIYLKYLIFAHQDDVVGVNNFLEWIVKVPKSFYYKRTKETYLTYLASLTITHKTYSLKKEKAVKYLKSI